mgnify:FL=1
MLEARRTFCSIGKAFTALRLHMLRREVTRLQSGTLFYRTLACAWSAWCAYSARGVGGTPSSFAARTVTKRAFHTWLRWVRSRARRRLELWVASRAAVHAGRGMAFRRWMLWMRRWRSRRRLPPLIMGRQADWVLADPRSEILVAALSDDDVPGLSELGSGVSLSNGLTHSANVPSREIGALVTDSAVSFALSYSLRGRMPRLLTAGRLAARHNALSRSFRRVYLCAMAEQHDKRLNTVAAVTAERNMASVAWRHWDNRTRGMRRLRRIGTIASKAVARVEMNEGFKAIIRFRRPRLTAARLRLAAAIGRWRWHVTDVRMRLAQHSAAEFMATAAAAIGAQLPARFALVLSLIHI